jgi:hypothetical protein
VPTVAIGVRMRGGYVLDGRHDVEDEADEDAPDAAMTG